MEDASRVSHWTNHNFVIWRQGRWCIISMWAHGPWSLPNLTLPSKMWAKCRTFFVGEPQSNYPATHPRPRHIIIFYIRLSFDPRDGSRPLVLLHMRSTSQPSKCGPPLCIVLSNEWGYIPYLWGHTLQEGESVGSAHIEIAWLDIIMKQSDCIVCLLDERLL